MKIRLKDFDASGQVDGKILTVQSGALVWGDQSGGGGGGITELSEDLTPQLGGDLDLNGEKIIGANATLQASSGQTQIISPNSQKAVYVNNTEVRLVTTLFTINGTINYPTYSGSAGHALVSDGTPTLVWRKLDPRVTTASASTTYTCDWSNADVIELTLTGNVTLTFTGAKPGQKCMLRLIQDATGGRTVTLPADVRFGGDITEFTPTATGGKMDRIGFEYVSSASKYDVIAVAKGY